LPASVPAVPKVDGDEDSYESEFGDGVFRYFVGGFPDKIAAMRCAIGPGMQRHVRRIKPSVRGGCVIAAPERHEFADRYHVEAALEHLVKRLRQLA